jgi:hypothetical protein
MGTPFCSVLARLQGLCCFLMVLVRGLQCEQAHCKKAFPLQNPKELNRKQQKPRKWAKHTTNIYRMEISKEHEQQKLYKPCKRANALQNAIPWQAHKEH